MSRVTQLSKLFHAISSHDWASAHATASELADAEAALGHHAAAARLRGALKPNGHSHAPALGPSDPTAVMGILSRLSTPESVADLALRDKQRIEIDALIKEWRNRARLQKHAVRRRSKILFHGPPGCGKSMAARAIAHQTSLPAHLVRLDAVVGAFLGQTALRVRELFRFAEIVPSVLLLDEVDALGRERGNAMDVGEVDRVVISVMQQLEHSDPAGFLIATSNLAPKLDVALVRRFDLVLEFPAPTRAERFRFGTARARAHSLTMTASLRKRIAAVSAYADIERILGDEKRQQLLRDK